MFYLPDQLTLAFPKGQGLISQGRISGINAGRGEGNRKRGRQRGGGN